MTAPEEQADRLEPLFDRIEALLEAGRLGEAAAMIERNGSALREAARPDGGEEPARTVMRWRAWRGRVDRLLCRCEARRTDLDRQLRAVRAGRRFGSLEAGSLDRARLDRRA